MDGADPEQDRGFRWGRPRAERGSARPAALKRLNRSSGVLAR